MRLASSIIIVGLIVINSPAASQACGGHRSRCHGHHHRPLARMTQPIYTSAGYAPVARSMTYASPQVAQATPPAVTPAPVAATPASTVAEAQPTYEYTASTDGQPAYYYTYDNSGKIIVAQWIDWVFRGGRAAGEPAPPLPLIGAFRNR